MSKLHDKITKKINKILYNIARQEVLKDTICNIGTIVEEEDKIICYANQKKIDKNIRKNHIYQIKLNGMNQVTDGIKETIKKLKLDKPVYYIFDGIEFSQGVKITSRWCNVIFKNCTFNDNIGIMWGDQIVFENNKYKDFYPIYYYGNCFLTADRVNKLTFINDNFYNSDENHDPTNFGMKIDAKIVEIINTKVDAESSITIEGDSQVILKNSIIKSDDIHIEATSIENVDSTIMSKSGVIAFNNKPNLIKSKEILQDPVELQTARKKLIEKLKDLSNYCQTLNNDRLEKIKHELDNQTINKTLKR